MYSTRFTPSGRNDLNLSWKLWIGIWILLSLVTGWYGFRFTVWDGFRPLQQIYFVSFGKSYLLKSIVPNLYQGSYTTLCYKKYDSKTKTLGTFFCVDPQVSPILNEKGEHLSHQNGELRFNYIDEDVKKITDFSWQTERYSSPYIYDRMKSLFYDNNDFPVTLVYPAIIMVITFFSGMTITIIGRKLITKKLFKGKHLRGTRLMTPAQFARKIRRTYGPTGIGLQISAMREE